MVAAAHSDLARPLTGARRHPVRIRSARHALGGTTMSHKLLLACTVFLALPGCEAIGNIFQAGIWTGVIGVVVVVALIIFLITRMRG